MGKPALWLPSAREVERFMDMMWTLLKRSRAKDATTEGAIAAGVTVTSMMVSIPKSSRRAPLSLAMKVPAASGRGRGSPTLKTFKPIGKALSRLWMAPHRCADD
jgi:hypothetical protein